MVTLRILTASHLSTAVPMDCNDEKSHVASDFFDLYLRNAILPLASCDTFTDINGIT